MKVYILEGTSICTKITADVSDILRYHLKDKITDARFRILLKEHNIIVHSEHVFFISYPMLYEIRNIFA